MTGRTGLVVNRSCRLSNLGLSNWGIQAGTIRQHPRLKNKQYVSDRNCIWCELLIRRKQDLDCVNMQSTRVSGAMQLDATAEYLESSHGVSVSEHTSHINYPQSIEPRKHF